MLSYHYKLLRFLGKKAIDYAVKKANNKYPPYKGKRTYYLRGTYKKTSNIEAKAASKRFQSRHLTTSYHKYKSMKGQGPYRNVPWVKLVSKKAIRKLNHKHKFKNYKLT